MNVTHQDTTLHQVIQNSSDDGVLGSENKLDRIDFVKAPIALGLIFLLVIQIDQFNVWLFSVAIVFVSVPITLHLAYCSSLKRGQKNLIFVENGWMHRLLSGVTFRLLICFVVGLLVAAITVFQLRAIDTTEILVLFLVIPIFLLSTQYITRPVTEQVVKPHKLRISIRLSQWITIGVYLGIYAFLLVTSQPPTTSSEPSINHFESAVVQQLSLLGDLWHYLPTYALQHSLEHNKLIFVVLVTILGKALFIYGLLSVISILLIPRNDLVRAIAPANNNPKAPDLSKDRIMWKFSLVSVFVIIFYFPVLVNVEARLSDIPIEQRPVEKLKFEVEFIAKTLVAIGTGQKLYNYRNEHIANSRSLADLEKKLNSAFNHVETNVDKFLDWYYSLSAEYARLGSLVTGNLDEYLNQKFEETLNKNNPFSSFYAAIEDGIKAEEQHNNEHRNATSEIINGNVISGIPQNLLRVTKINFNDSKLLGAYKAAENRFKQRGLYSIGIGLGTTTVVSDAVAKKIVSKNIMKNGIKALKNYFILNTSWVGAALGTTIAPGVGTIVGAAVGIGVDALLINLEELIERDEFRKELLKPINETRLEMLSALHSTESLGF